MLVEDPQINQDTTKGQSKQGLESSTGWIKRSYKVPIYPKQNHGTYISHKSESYLLPREMHIKNSRGETSFDKEIIAFL